MKRDIVVFKLDSLLYPSFRVYNSDGSTSNSISLFYDVAQGVDLMYYLHAGTYKWVRCLSGGRPLHILQKSSCSSEIISLMERRVNPRHHIIPVGTFCVAGEVIQHLPFIDERREWESPVYLLKSTQEGHVFLAEDELNRLPFN